MSELLNLEEMSMEHFLAELKAEETAKMVLLQPEPSPEGFNSSSGMDEDVLDVFRQQRASHFGYAVL